MVETTIVNVIHIVFDYTGWQHHLRGCCTVEISPLLPGGIMWLPLILGSLVNMETDSCCRLVVWSIVVDDGGFVVDSHMVVFVVVALPSVVEDTVDSVDVVEIDAFVDEEVGFGFVGVICVGWIKPVAC